MGGVESEIDDVDELNLYPTGVVVKNTFIDFESSAEEFLGEFFRRREIRSAPSSTADSCEDFEEAEASSDLQSPEEVVNNDFDVTLPTAPKIILSLTEAIPRPLPISVSSESAMELPSMGSAEHHLGTCKPCAFVYRNCTEGVNCTFCHMCGPDERRKRRKAKIEHLRKLRQLQAE